MQVLQVQGMSVDKVEIQADEIELQAHLTRPEGVCPGCGQTSGSVHSRYRRKLRDLPMGRRRVRLCVAIRRFRCRYEDCHRLTFAEPLEGLATAFARRTERLTLTLRAISLATGAESGSRLARQLRMETSPDTLLRVLRQTIVPAVGEVRVLGVDDWAMRRGKRYGTLLVDLEQQRPVELLPDRTAETLATWLGTQDKVEIVSRDRSTEYRRGISMGAPQAQQIADRWHLLQNLREALERMLSRLHAELEQLPLPSPAEQPVLPVRSLPLDALKPNRQASKQASRARRWARYEAVRALALQGVPEVRIARQLGLARATVRLFARSDSFPERALSRGKESMIDPYLPYLLWRMTEGCTVTSQLWREIQARGYTGSRHQVARWVQQHRTTPAPTTPHRYRSGATSPEPNAHKLSLPAPRQLVWCLLRSDEDQSDDEKAHFARIRQHPLVETAYHLARQFQRMIRDHSDAPLAQWLHSCLEVDIPDLQTFAAGLQREEPSISLALSTPWNNGPVEGHVNRLKFIKRSMYGRAKFDLLRIRVLAASA